MHKHKISLYNLIVILVHLMMPDHLRYYQTYSFAMKILNNMNYLHFHFIYIRWLWIEKQKKNLSTKTWAHIERIQNLHFSFVPTLKLIRLDFLSIKNQQSICPSFFHYSISFGWYLNANLSRLDTFIVLFVLFFRHTNLSLDTSDVSAYQRSVISLSRLRYSNPLISGVVIFVRFWFGKRLSNFWQMKWNMPRKSVSDQNHAIEKLFYANRLHVSSVVESLAVG